MMHGKKFRSNKLILNEIKKLNAAFVNFDEIESLIEKMLTIF